MSKNAFQNLKRNRFLSFDNFNENVGVPTNYVSLAIYSLSDPFYCIKLS
ncbi:hypothetical protein LEP1GSC165_3244 [Leptospira santarosai str. CBC523]|nr:hypothetical protein LEP1GSC165_3244 [Leptospira santarosai str. CBC523]